MSTLAALFGNVDLQRGLLIGAVAITVLMLALGLSFIYLRATDQARRRIGDLGPTASGGSLAQVLTNWTRPVARFVLPGDDKERGSMQKKLQYAGYRSSSALPGFYSTKSLLAITLPVIAFLVTKALPSLTSTQVLMSCAGASFVGLVLPNYVLNRKVESRQKLLRNGFPDALDLLVVCVESGLGLAAAIQRVSDELGVSHPALAQELLLVNAEMRAGVEREVALRHLADRTGLDDIRGLVGLLVQTLRFGTSISDALRVYSEEFRDKRMQKAEEQAGKISTKLIFPLVLCMFPGFFVVAVGPAAIKIVQAFSSLTGGK